MIPSLVRALALAAAALAIGVGAPSPAHQGADDPGELTLMTFNIRYATPRDGPDAWEHRRALVAEVILAANPDIVGLQEALGPQLDDLAPLLPGYTATGVGRDDGARAGEHAAILYREDRFQIADHGTFWLSDTPEVPGSKSWGNTITRICTWARFLPRGGRGPESGFYIYNVHLDHQSQPSRARGIELVAQHMADRAHPDVPAVLMGDFNAGESNPVIRYIKGAAPRASETDDPTFTPPPSPALRCALRAANPDAEEVGTYHAFEGKRAGDLIDYIFVPRDTEVRSAEIVRTRNDEGRHPSDHFPVVGRVRLPPTPPK